MIQVKNLSRKYGGFTAVHNLSFEVPKGQIVGLLGHNGAGKTTTLKMLTGYLEPTNGDISIGGLDLEDNRHQIQARLGYLSESSPLYPDMPVWQYLNYVAELRSIEEHKRPQAVREALEATDMLDKGMQDICTLSRGYQQRLGVAQAIIHKPEILILDEPTNGLDPTQIFAMRQLIKNLAKSSTVIISTHIMQEVEAICDRVLIILDGKIAVDSSLEDLQTNNTIELRLKQPYEEVSSILAKIKGVDSVEQVSSRDNLFDYRLKVSESTNSFTPKIARSIFDQGWDVYRINSEQKTLEEVFREVNSLGGMKS